MFGFDLTNDQLETQKAEAIDWRDKIMAENINKQIDDLKMAGLNIFLGKDGELSIIVKFEGIEDLKAYDKHSRELRKDLNSSFNFTEVKYSGVCVFSYENEATDISISPN